MITTATEFRSLDVKTLKAPGIAACGIYTAVKLSKIDRLNYRQLEGMSPDQSRVYPEAQAGAIADDAALMQRAAAGDQSAWREIVESHLSAMRGLAYRMSLQDSAAEDVTQEAFLRLWKIAPQWKPEARIATWLYRVVRNLAIDAIRRRKTNASEELDDGIDSGMPTPLEALSLARSRAQVTDAVGQLPDRQRTAIMLVHFGELSGAEAAGIMKVSIEALESLLARGRRNLKCVLSKESA